MEAVTTAGSNMCLLKTDYKVAGHIFRLSLPYNHLLVSRLSNYLPFICDNTGDSCELLFQAEVVGAGYNLPEKKDIIGHFEDDTAVIDVFKTSVGGYIFHIGNSSGICGAKMLTDYEFKKAYIQLNEDESISFFGLNNCIMMLYAFASAKHKTLLMHASVIENNNKAHLFLGKSGTGKSTHSRLWLEHIADSELLNDDNPVVRVENNGNVYVYGSPWSGKTHCYKSHSATTGAFVRLQQAQQNKIEANNMVKGFAALMPSCSWAPWDKNIHNSICNTISHILENIKTYTLNCLPDKDAAVLCYKTINELNI